MSALILAAAMFLGQDIVVLPPELSTEEAQSKYEQTCKGAAAKTQPCKLLQWQLEYALYEDLQQVWQGGQLKLDDELLDAGAAADCPQLKSFALDRIRERGRLKPNEEPLVIAALNDPYPLARKSAYLLAGQLKDEKWSRMAIRRGRHEDESSNALDHAYPQADEAPTAKDLGVPLPEGAQFQYFASDDQRAFFLTSQSADKVLAWYAAKGKKAITGTELRQRAQAGKQAMASGMQQDPMAMARKMQEAMAQGKNPQDVIADMQKEQMGGAKALDVDWTQEWDNKESQGVQDPKFVVIDETKVGSVSVPSSEVLVFTDKVLGGTALVVHRVPEPPPMPTQADMQNQMKLQQQVQHDPMAHDVYQGDLGSDE